MLFGVLDWIRDITRRSGIVRRMRFIYCGSFSKLGNVPECLYGDSRRFQNVLEGSRRFLGVCLKTKKGSRSLCGARHGFVGEEDSSPLPIRRPRRKGSPTRTPPPMAPPSFKERGGGTNPLAPSMLQISSCLSPPPSLCSGLGEALQNSLLHHHHIVVLLGFRGEDLLPPLLAGTGRGRSASTPHV